jgi:hypothetical protein
MVEPAPIVDDTTEAGDDGPVHEFYAFIARTRARFDLDTVEGLRAAIDAWESDR